MVRIRFAVAFAALVALGCSGVGGGAADPGFGTISHSTWETSGGKYRLVFKGGDDVVYTWRNMSGKAVSGSFEQSGNDVHIEWVPVDHLGSLAFDLTRTEKCALVLHTRKDKDGSSHELSDVFQRTIPECKD